MTVCTPSCAWCVHRVAHLLVHAQPSIVPSCTHPRLFLTSKARWPSGLRRQLKVLPIRWSERAWVQIPLSSLSFCCYTTILGSRRQVVEWVKIDFLKIRTLNLWTLVFAREAGLHNATWQDLCYEQSTFVQTWHSYDHTQYAHHRHLFYCHSSLQSLLLTCCPSILSLLRMWQRWKRQSILV